MNIFFYFLHISAYYGCQRIEAAHEHTKQLLNQQNIISMSPSHPFYHEKILLTIVKFNYGNLRSIAPQFGSCNNENKE